MVLLVQLARTERLDRGDSRACLARRETKVPGDSPASQDPSDCRVCLDPPARRERTETSEPWVHLVLLDPEVLRVLAAPAVHKVHQGVLVQREQSVRREKMVKLETRVQVESLVFQASEARRVRREILAHLELLDPPVPEDPLEMTVQRVTLVPSASRETQVHLVSLVLLVLMVYPVTKEMMEMLDNLALLVHLGRLEYQDLLAKGEPPEQQVH